MAQRTLTPNQIVGDNLKRRRRGLGLTQDDAGARLESFIGERWSKSAFSHAENGTRPRQFSADELVAIAMAFEIPLSTLLTPAVGVRVKLPSGRTAHRDAYRIAIGADNEYALLQARDALVRYAIGQTLPLPKTARLESIAGMAPELITERAAQARRTWLRGELAEDRAAEAREQRRKGAKK